MLDRTIQFRSIEQWKSFLEEPKRKPSLAAKQVRFIDLFSSIGGLSIGLGEAISESGFAPKSLLAADVDVLATQVYKANWPGCQPFEGSVRELVDSHIIGQGDGAKFAYPPVIVEEQLARNVGKVDIVIAGPPCQGNSSLNNISRGDDPRNDLYLQVPAIAIALGARQVIIENVPGVIREKNNVVGTAARLLENAGYHVETGVLSADKFGWPQTRKRFFLVADRDSKPIPFSEIQEQMARPPESLGWILESATKMSKSDDLMDKSSVLSPENQRRAKFLVQHDLYDLPLDQRPDCHKSGTTYISSYGRMRVNSPAPTLTTGFFSPGRGRFLHPTEPRTLTAREGSMVQGFPSYYHFNPTGRTTRVNLAKWIGDAVPPILGYVAAKSLGY